MQVLLERELPADARSVSTARRLVRDAFVDSGWGDRADDAALATSELATNAVVHAGGDFTMRVLAWRGGVRVELCDGSDHVPSPRRFAETAGTGRGLLIVAEGTDRWGVDPRPPGKVVWFEIGARPDTQDGDGVEAEDLDEHREVLVELLDVPLLMHWAWHEHAQTLLREYLLDRLYDDERILPQHAAASQALTALHEGIPLPTLPQDPDALLAESLDPGVTAERLVLRLDRDVIPHFTTLELLLSRAVEAARQGLFLAPPTQPEIEELREWLCDEVVRQAAGAGGGRPWRTRTDVRTPLADPEDVRRQYAGLVDAPGHRIVTDEASVIVAVSRSVVEFLGYGSPEELIGRRIIVIVPSRYHQAHIAGTTLNATNGRDKLLDLFLEVPVVRADGTEVVIGLEVGSRLLEDRTRVFVAEMDLVPREPGTISAHGGDPSR